MTELEKTRRDFIKQSATMFGASWLGLNLPEVLLAGETATTNHRAQAEYQNITRAEAIELSAIADQIIPEDVTPGATEMGVVYFIDYALGGFMAGQASMLRQGMSDLQKATQQTHEGASSFSELSFEQQTKLLKSVEDTPFFGTMHMLTLCGVFAMPGYGGNKDYAGWTLLGFDHQHAWQPPFGYYDTAAHQKNSVKGVNNEKT